MSTFTKEDLDHLKTFADELNTVPNSQLQEKKLILVGDGGVGKSTFVQRMLKQAFNPRYVATLGVEVYPIVDYKRKIQYNIWDTAGQEKFGGLRDGYYLDADLAIIMYDMTSKLTSRSIERWELDVRKMCPDIPIIIIGNKGNISRKCYVENSIIMSSKTMSDPALIFTLLHTLSMSAPLTNVCQINNEIEESSKTYVQSVVLKITEQRIKDVTLGCFTQHPTEDLSIGEMIAQYAPSLMCDANPTLLNLIGAMYNGNLLAPFEQMHISLEFKFTEHIANMIESHEGFVCNIKRIDDQSIWTVNGNLLLWIDFIKESTKNFNNEIDINILGNCVGEIFSIFPEIEVLI